MSAMDATCTNSDNVAKFVTLASQKHFGARVLKSRFTRFVRSEASVVSLSSALSHVLWLFGGGESHEVSDLLVPNLLTCMSRE